MTSVVLATLAALLNLISAINMIRWRRLAFTVPSTLALAGVVGTLAGRSAGGRRTGRYRMAFLFDTLKKADLCRRN
jgi:hypothetical protein